MSKSFCRKSLASRSVRRLAVYCNLSRIARRATREALATEDQPNPRRQLILILAPTHTLRQIDFMKETQEIILATLCGSDLLEKVAAVYLLGSVVKGTMRSDSDIDIAILPRNDMSISLQDRIALIGSLSLALRHEVDLGIITAQNLIYASEAILTGKRFLTLDTAYVDQTEMRLLGGYLQLRFDRREIEEAYHAA